MAPVTLEEAVRQLRADLQDRSPLWEVEVQPGLHGRVSVGCRHPASAGLAIDVDPNDEQHLLAVLAASSLDEVRIASAAPTLRDPERVQSVRSLIKAFKWTQPEVRGLAFVLFEYGFLSEDETAWIAGFAAVDAPMRPVSPISPE